MRALCGAIITAGAAIGLGLTALGIGTRYQFIIQQSDPQGEHAMHLFQLDTPLIFSIVFLTIVTLIGLGIAFVGLAYHHHRRHHEHLWELERRGGSAPDHDGTTGDALIQRAAGLVPAVRADRPAGTSPAARFRAL